MKRIVSGKVYLLHNRPQTHPSTCWFGEWIMCERGCLQMFVMPIASCGLTMFVTEDEEIETLQHSSVPSPNAVLCLVWTTAKVWASCWTCRWMWSLWSSGLGSTNATPKVFIANEGFYLREFTSVTWKLVFFFLLLRNVRLRDVYKPLSLCTHAHFSLTFHRHTLLILYLNCRLPLLCDVRGSEASLRKMKCLSGWVCLKCCQREKKKTVVKHNTREKSRSNTSPGVCT